MDEADVRIQQHINTYVALKSEVGTLMGVPVMDTELCRGQQAGYVCGLPPQMVIQNIRDGLGVYLWDAFELRAALKTDGKQQVREPLLLPLDFMLQRGVVHIMRPLAVYFCGWMQEDDRRLYESFLSHHRRMQELAGASAKLPSGSSLPSVRTYDAGR